MRIQLAGETDFAGFRKSARTLLARGVRPHAVHWSTRMGDDLFGEGSDEVAETAQDAPSSPVSVPARIVHLCETAALHADPQRFALLYRLLWRLQGEPGLRDDPLDADILAVRKMANAVGHEMHKMRAFVRFRQVPHPRLDGETLHVAWFEPTHHVVEANAPWFMRRFTQMHWAILTPLRCVEWDRRELSFREGARADEAPPADAGEQLWLTYYASIFNPARLKLAMMEKEMPRRYWRNLPESRLIAPLASAAAQRTGGMIEAAATQPDRRIRAKHTASRVEPALTSLDAGVGPESGDFPGQPDVMPIRSLAALQAAATTCAFCPIGAMATQAVHGEGPLRPTLMFVGEQPGDREDLEGRVFVGPAGQLLDRAFGQAGIARSDVYLTNAVRHFKYEVRGKRRIHKTPAQAEAAACAQWLEHEITLVRPQGIVALGATAARSLLGRHVAVTSERGEWQRRADGVPVFVTVHPSSILRLPPDETGSAFDRFVADLREAARQRW